MPFFSKVPSPHWPPIPRPALVTCGNTRTAAAVGPSALASGVVAHNVCRADRDSLASSAAAVLPLSARRRPEVPR